MNTDFEISFRLLSVGMLTVFAILTIVVLSSKILIYLVNRIEPEEQISSQDINKKIPDNIQDVIRQTVSVITGGKGKVEHIKQID